MIIFSCKRESGQIDEKAAIEKILELIIESDNTENIGAISELYADDAVLLPPGGKPIIGLARIRAHYEFLFENFDFQDLKFETDETLVSVNLAVNSGNTKGKVIGSSSGSTTEVNDKYVMVLKKIEGNWKIKNLIWNKNPQ